MKAKFVGSDEDLWIELECENPDERLLVQAFTRDCASRDELTLEVGTPFPHKLLITTRPKV